MQCDVVRLRVRGVRLLAASHLPVTGLLELDELQASAFGRALRIARLLDPERPLGTAELIPPRLDAQLLQIRQQRLVLTGIERLATETGMTDYAQTWVVMVVG